MSISDRETGPPAPELEAEQEVDFGRYARAIAARWWLVVIGAAAGAIIGFLVTLGGGKMYKATAQVYLGQPLAPLSATPVSSSPTSLGLISNFVTGEETIRQAAAKARLKPSKLRGRVTTKPILGITGAKVGTPAPLMAITVTGSSRGKTAAAANALAAAVVEEASGYTGTKIDTLDEQLVFDNRLIETTNARLTTARSQQAEVLANRKLGLPERLLLLANINTTLITLEGRLRDLESDRFQVREQLALSRDVEQARITVHALSVKTKATGARASVLVGAVIGLILGALAALFWEPIADRVRSRPA